MDIPEGAIITREMLNAKRSGVGIEAKYEHLILGRETRKSIKKDTPITLDSLEYVWEWSKLGCAKIARAVTSLKY